MAKLFLIPLFSPFLALFFAGSIDAQENRIGTATEWVETDYGRSRLIFSHEGLSKSNLEPYFLAWEIELTEGWKTYWRSPGDAGKPTTISFEGSENVKTTETFFPLPMRFELFGITTYGYEDRLILPINIEPEDRTRPLTLKTTVNYMVCEKVCVLMDHDYQLTIPAKPDAGASAYQQAIMDYVATVPKAQSTILDSLRIKEAHVFGPVGHQSLVVDLVGANHLSGADIIVENDGKFHFGIPKRQLLADGKTVRFKVSSKSYDPRADLRDQSLTIIMKDGWGGAYERQLSLTP